MHRVIRIGIIAIIAVALAWASGSWVSNNAVPTVKIWRDSSSHWDWNTGHTIDVKLNGDPNTAFYNVTLYESVSRYPTIDQCYAQSATHKPYVDGTSTWRWWWSVGLLSVHASLQYNASCHVTKNGPGGTVWVTAWETHQGATPPRPRAAYSKEVP